MNDNTTDALNKLSKEALVNFIAGLYGQEKYIDNRIDVLMVQNDPKALHKKLKKQVASLKRSTRFIAYNQSFEFSIQLDVLVSNIEKVLLPQSSKLAFEVVNLFLLTASSTFERVDDSGGGVGESYKTAVLLWLKAASEWRVSDAKCKIDWPEAVYNFFQENDYGAYDDLIPGSAELLSEDELRQLAWRFENNVQKLLKTQANNDSDYDFEAASASMGMRSVAEALGDVGLFERSYLITNTKLNEMIKKSIVTFCLAQNEPESALRWLNDGWKGHANTRLKLLDACYEKMT